MRTWFAVASLLVAVLLLAETPPSSPAPIPNLTATTANVAGAPDSVRIEILRWSTDEERDRLISAWNLKPAASAGPNAASGAGKGAGKAAAKGKGAAKGPGGGGGGGSTQTPEAALTRALQESATVGYLWSSEMAGYALRYAGKVDNPDGSQRIILITQRKLGAVNQVWKPTVDGPSNPYEFSVIELRLNAKGEGEGKISLTGAIAADAAARIVTIENYSGLPVVLRDVRKRATNP